MRNPPSPLVRDFLMALGRTGVKAAAAALDSVLEDAQGVADEAVRRVRKGRKRLHKIRHNEPQEEEE